VTLHARDRFVIPEETVRVAEEAFPKGTDASISLCCSCSQPIT
jgi:hypothetical protein